MVYIISYTLHHTHDYEPLHKAIKDISGIWWHHTTSAWLTESSLSAAQIFNLLQAHVHNADDLLVIRVQGDWHARIHDTSSMKWLQDRKV